MKRLVYLFILSSFVLGSCEELDADIPTPKGEKKVIVSSFISPDDGLIKAYVLYSSPVFSTPNDDLIVEDAIVTISDGTYSDTLEYAPDYYLYFLSTSIYPIEGGKSYTLNVQTPSGYSAHAVCKVPESELVDFTYTTDSIIINNQIQFIYEMNWNYSGTSEKFYRTDAEMIYFYNDTINGGFHSEMLELTPDSDTEFFYSNGSPTVLKMKYRAKPIPTHALKSVKLLLYNTDKPYYLFHTKSNPSLFMEIDDATNKPYSNINGGLGIFASYNNTVMKDIF